MDNNDLKKWLTEQVSYLEKTKEQPEKFAWNPEYDLQLAAFRLAIEALHGTCNHFREVTKMVPLTLKQLQEMNGEPVWITSVKKDGKIPSRWVLYSGKSESQEREDVYVFATTGGIAQGYKGATYGKTWLAYAYQPTHINRMTWVSVSERMPDKDQVVIVIANGKPRENITLDGAFELAEWSESDGWILACWPDWENPVVTHWMPIPVPPKGEHDG
ncbi:DUF551 domain-containing protein [Candidatus Allofournierella merdipullorum]|uniref:DUF551 domain-containing protein n=1 Tax=Candidatus Allofournierella merdipullorum TaxID=2838595 RepID=UPI00374E7EBB